MPDFILSYGVEDTFTALDGRNHHKLASLSPFLSELALTTYRITTELAYLQKLSEVNAIRKLTTKEKVLLKNLSGQITTADYKRIRIIEQSTNHEMKSIEEFLKEKLRKTTLKDIVEMVHFGLTSEDINNLSYALILKESLDTVLLPEIEKINHALLQSAKKYKNLPMLARTHGQPAAPTTVGKEFLVFYKRLREEIALLKKVRLQGKLLGNTGNMNAYKLVYPKINWLKFSKKFVASLGLEPNLVATQIQPYDSMIRLFQNLQRINNILEGLAKDMWLYISMGYFSQKVISKEVGSTALPHKVNPIYFEGAEGGLALASALFSFYADKLSYSRLQRDLSDSTVRRSIPIALCYSFLSYQSIIEALSRIEPSKKKITDDLSYHWEVLSEAMQNFLRSKNYTDAYEKTKQFFRGKIFGKEQIARFITSLAISNADKQKLLELTPENYIGFAKEIVDYNNYKKIDHRR